MDDSPTSTCECGRTFTQEQSSGVFCFRCKLDGLHVNFVGGGGYGREAFHNRTNSEVMAEQERGAKRAGITTMEKKSTRAELV